MVILGSAGLASLQPHHFISAVLPVPDWLSLGNLDHDLRFFLQQSHTSAQSRSSAGVG
ncbi:2-keto-3-deoxygluconate permease [Shigella flexneri]